MNRWLAIGAGVACGLAAGATAAVAGGTAVWDATTRRAVRELAVAVGDVAVGAADAAPFSRDDLAGLPEPVARYFELVLRPGQRTVRRARFEQRGDMRSSGDAAWSAFTAVEHFSTRPIGFLWDASMRVAPLIALRVRDGYAHGEGASEAKIAALVSVSNQHGTPEMAAGSLVRYLAEAPWLPTALLPSAGVVWTPVDRTHARATLVDHGTSVSIDVAFGERGEIERVSTLRFRLVDGAAVLTPWSGVFRDYERFDGMLVPTAADASWTTPEDSFTVWRGRILSAEYTFADT